MIVWLGLNSLRDRIQFIKLILIFDSSSCSQNMFYLIVQTAHLPIFQDNLAARILLSTAAGIGHTTHVIGGFYSLLMCFLTVVPFYQPWNI